MTQPQLSTSDMDALVDALHAVLVLVAGADGVVDPREEQRFVQLLAAAAEIGEPLHTVVERARAKMPPAAAAQAVTHEAAVDRIRAGAAVADSRLAVDDAERFKDGLYRMGKALAEASGGFLGLGKRQSQEEKDALAVLAICLGITER